MSLQQDAPKINPVITLGLTISEAVKAFEIDYWKEKKRTKQKANLARIYGQLPQEAELTIELLLGHN